MENLEELIEKMSEILDNITPETVARLTDEELEQLEELLEKLGE